VVRVAKPLLADGNLLPVVAPISADGAALCVLAGTCFLQLRGIPTEGTDGLPRTDM